MNFSNKVVLITGAGSGIGRTAAIMFADRGARLAVNDISEQRGHETVEIIKQRGGEAAFVGGDVAKDAEKIVKKTVETFGKIDVLVNNAGIVPYGNIEETSDEDFTRTIEINVKGPFLLSKYAVEEMKKQKSGVIVNIASEAGLVGIPRRCVYSISKAALIGLTRSLAVDYVDFGIRVNAICPGTTYSQGLAQRVKASADPEETMRRMVSRIPMKRLGKEEEIAFAIMFAACDEASFMTGSIINIDGGSTMI
ncbi:MAG TPA: SDR family oxidoreductase [Pseudothermotoga sp.]|nr:SDR family oxidoreductase [Pseudothermotoga sp.]HOK83525.1 SDR family oxidoreductase [Pseudothermotoga sp.]HPP69598.1 SDR family oxidoreductase [Pseudothermotoga sp.]